jgi:UDP-3-O-[3-hydroxymyristoyl] glucosamine N-acyltransferase
MTYLTDASVGENAAGGLFRQPLKAFDIATLIKGRLLGDDVVVTGISALDIATAGDLSFVIWPQDIRFAKKSRAGLIIADVAFAADYADLVNSSLIVVEDMARAFNDFADFFRKVSIVKPSRCIHPQARIHELAIVEDAIIEKDVVIGPFAIVKSGAFIGQGTHIAAGVQVLENVVIHERCQIGANSVIGSQGFVPYGDKTPQLLPCFGGVVIKDDVRIGAQCTVDRGLFTTTSIGKNTLIDNLVHVGHDVAINDSVIIAAQCGFAGFVRLKDGVTCGGQVGIKPHVTVGEGARISGKSLVHCDIKKHEIWSGNPSLPHALYLRSYGKIKRASKEKHS